MNSRTILSAFLARRDDLEDRYIIHGPRRARMEIQLSKFYMELLRRMDQRDDLVAEKADRVARLQVLYAARPGVKPWSSDR